MHPIVVHWISKRRERSTRGRHIQWHILRACDAVCMHVYVCVIINAGRSCRYSCIQTIRKMEIMREEKLQCISSCLFGASTGST